MRLLEKYKATSRKAADHQQKIMVVLTGAYGNIGDVVIRRRILNWVADLGETHAYIGNADSGWVDQLGFDSSANVYRSNERLRWLATAFSYNSRVALVLDPGEVPLGRSSLFHEFFMFSLTAVVKARGGKVIRPPRGIGTRFPLTVGVHKAAARLSDVVLWRNKKSKAFIGSGELSPDTAFQEPADWQTREDDRPHLVVSMRGKRPLPSDEWFAAVHKAAELSGLHVLCVSQVREDENRNLEIADRLGAQFCAWSDAGDFRHELKLKQIYQSARFVMSDRLHVLILGLMQGAMPIEFVDRPVDKVRIHFEQVGIHGVSVDSSRGGADRLLEAMSELSRNRERVRSLVGEASSRLDHYRERVRAALLDR